MISQRLMISWHVGRLTRLASLFLVLLGLEERFVRVSNQRGRAPIAAGASHQRRGVHPGRRCPAPQLEHRMKLEGQMPQDPIPFIG